MTWVDSLLNSSLLAWGIIGYLILSMYLKKTGKTFLEAMKEVTEFFKELFGGSDE